MTKKTSKGATAKTAALSPEELKKLTPEQIAAHIDGLQSANDELKAKLKDAKPSELPSFEVDADEENDVEGGEYQFTAPTFTWDDNSVINVRELMADAEGSDKKAATAAGVILAQLVARKSGLVRRKED